MIQSKFKGFFGDLVKKILRVLGIGIGIVIANPILLIVCIGYLCFVPFDILRYHQMPYYKDFRIKYQFFITSSDIVKIYNYIVRARLPIKYFINDGFEYFLKDGQVLLCGWSDVGFEQVDDAWYFVFEGECKTSMPMKEVMENELERLSPEHKCLPAKFLIFYNDITDAEKWEQAKNCPYFYCAFSVDEI